MSVPVHRSWERSHTWHHGRVRYKSTEIRTNFGVELTDQTNGYKSTEIRTNFGVELTDQAENEQPLRGGDRVQLLPRTVGEGERRKGGRASEG
eukprot:410104-Rhodomonas_salina.2